MNRNSDPSCAKERAYVVCGCKSWNRDLFDRELACLPGTWTPISSREELKLERVRDLNPRYIFFLHWSWIVPNEITNQWECVNFHMTDLPYGRGGSPLQNLILRGHRTTKLTAHRMMKELDAGPVYLKESLSLAGSAEEILMRASGLAASMVRTIVEKEPQPKPQEGEVVTFERRTPEQSAIPQQLSTEQLYDFIRMLDAEGYPHAFLEQNGFRFTFGNARLKDGSVSADVAITPISSR